MIGRSALLQRLLEVCLGHPHCHELVEAGDDQDRGSDVHHRRPATAYLLPDLIVPVGRTEHGVDRTPLKQQCASDKKGDDDMDQGTDFGS